MATISVSLPADGSTADVADYNTPITTVVNAINGNLDSNNISSLTGTKITAGTIPGTALDSSAIGGWIAGLAAPNTIACNGNRSYTLTFNSVNYSTSLSPGMRLRSTRTVAAPTQCTSLNGSTQYYSKSSPAGMTFTDDFTVSAWVKVSSYAGSAIVSRYNGTSGWSLQMQASGQINLNGYNAGAANYSQVLSYQSVPLNKWVHITAQLDMSTFTATTTTSYVMIDGVDVPVSVARGGTNPTALVQAGNLEIGGQNGGTVPFPGKIAQAAIFNAKVTQATMRTYMSQGLAGTETSLISAYSFNNTINDLNANANNLTANGSAVATATDSPFGGQADGTISSTLDYGIVQSVSFSTNTTVVVQVAEGCTIPTSGGVSAVVYSSNKSPYGLPSQRSKWVVDMLFLTLETITFSGTNTWMQTNERLTVPIGEWKIDYQSTIQFISTGSGARSGFVTLASSAPTNSVYSQVLTSRSYISSAGTSTMISLAKYSYISQGASSTYSLYVAIDSSTGTESFNVYGAQSAITIAAENAYL